MKIIVAIAVLAVAIILAFGLMTMFRGGQENRMRSQKLMRLRVAAQAIAVIVIMIALWMAGQGPG